MSLLMRRPDLGGYSIRNLSVWGSHMCPVNQDDLISVVLTKGL